MPYIALREFHISRQARARYQFEHTLFSFNGNVIFANFYAARIFAQKMNEKRDVVNFPERAVRAGQINAMGLIDELLHVVVQKYREQRAPKAIEDALDYLEATLGASIVDEALRTFVDEFPPAAVYRGELSVEDYLEGKAAHIPHREVVLEEMLMLWIANLNPALSPFIELFEDGRLEKSTAYPQVMLLLDKFFEQQPRFGPQNQTLTEMLRAPSKASPHSLEGQLEYMRTQWGEVLGEYLYRLLSSLDFLAEETKAFFGPGPGPAEIYEFGGMDIEAENFSPDSVWMPRLVLIAKNAFVWLDQLSKAYQRAITTLDQVPDEELDKLAQWGITGLWLIGLWQRSEASKRIKQIMGNPEAVASAYSLDAYRVADDLGGEAAYENLKQRAWQRGIRMASDMVPNHMGIDSQWVIEHPDWFISLPHPPFPTYSYDGENLSPDDRVGIYIEDHYYTRSDAAVTFKRVDHWTGNTHYIYHGNDGTSMPWNDTAQLNYLMPEVREAVIQTILAVAQRSPIIRFDAAMTLTKRHYQRLWFPEPGTGGDIPSRAGHGMTKHDFEAAVPEEFWREVVDRVAAEAPDTLLLAEAFWLMEGYFVRTLGMHRVYNSAFMNMLRDEKNAEYRQVIQNTLEFDPQILKRYVNFMNNPDERTAVDQFGKGDKYFGISTMLATMPGLPMLGHGQVEGYTEKYGMEYRRAYWDETPDRHLVQRHEQQIFPLLHRRYLFAEVDDFLLYDFFTPEGRVDENVFAYSNRTGDGRSLILYHNKYAETRGHIRTSVAYAVKGDNGEKRLVQRTLAEGLHIPNEANTYLIFRDAITGMEYMRNAQDLCQNGLYAELHAYQAHAFVEFREVHDNEWQHYRQLCDYLNGRGVPNIEEALKELFLAPIHSPYRMLVSAPAFQWLMDARAQDPGDTVEERVLEQVEQKMLDLVHAIEHATENGDHAEDLAVATRAKVEIALSLSAHLTALEPEEASYGEAVAYLLEDLTADNIATWGTLLSLLFTRPLGKVVDPEHFAEISRSWMDEWLLGKRIANALQDSGLEQGAAQYAVTTINMLISYTKWFRADEETVVSTYHVLHRALQQHDVHIYLGINRHQGILWFNKEAFEQWLWWLMMVRTLDIMETATTVEAQAEPLRDLYSLVKTLQQAAAHSDYQVAKLLEAVQRE